MKLLLNAIRVNPNHIEEIAIEDVANFTVDDTQIVITYNNKIAEVIPLRANDGENINEWSGFSIFGTRIAMKVDMEK